jgi:hypothetical protein
MNFGGERRKRRRRRERGDRYGNAREFREEVVSSICGRKTNVETIFAQNDTIFLTSDSRTPRS